MPKRLPASTWLIYTLLLALPLSSKAEEQCEAERLRETIAPTDNLPPVALRDLVFQCTQVASNLRGLDSLDLDLFYSRARAYSYTLFSAMTTDESSPRKYSTLTTESTLKAFWNFVQKLYIEETTLCSFKEGEIVLTSHKGEDPRPDIRLSLENSPQCVGRVTQWHWCTACRSMPAFRLKIESPNCTQRELWYLSGSLRLNDNQGGGHPFSTFSTNGIYEINYSSIPLINCQSSQTYTQAELFRLLSGSSIPQDINTRATNIPIKRTGLKNE